MCTVCYKPTPKKRLQQVRKSAVPTGGWTMEVFQSQAGKNLVLDVIAARKIIAAYAIPPFANKVKELVMAQVRRVGERVKGLYGLYGKKQLLTDEQEVQAALLLLWYNAIEQEFGIGPTTLVSVELRPAYQSVMAATHDRYLSLLGGREATKEDAARIAREVDILTRQVGRINPTTMKIVKKAVENTPLARMSVDDAIDEVTKKVEDVMKSRGAMIAHNEVRDAADRGAILAMLAVGTVTHVSVFGCKAVEPGIPTYAGRPTCNIKNVPVYDAGSLRYHPNHTGVLVPTGFVEEGGGTPRLPLVST